MAAKDQRFSDALRRAVMREIEIEEKDGAKTRTVAIDALAQTLIARGVGGDVTAIKEIVDRLEGKAKQSLEAEVNANITLVDALVAAAAREDEGK